jgi:uncharacterized protein (DUF58 family)
MKFPWKHKKVYIYPNRFGFLFFGLFCLMLMVGGAYTNNLIFLMGFILISFLFVVILLTAKNLRNIEIVDVQFSPGFPGEIVPVKVTVENTADFEHTRLFIKLDGFKNDAELFHIGPNDRTEIILSVTLPEKRGVYNVGRIKVSTENPFGLFFSWFWYKFNIEHLVYPQPAGLKERPKQENEVGDEFSGLKEYEIGDPMSRISWKHLARNDQMLVKEFNDSELQQDLLDIKETKQISLEDKLSQLALWLLEAEKGQRLYSLEIGSGHKPPNRGPKHLHECLDELARVGEA